MQTRTHITGCNSPVISGQECSQDFILGAQKLSAEGASIEVPKAPRGVGIGEGVSANAFVENLMSTEHFW